MPDGTRYWGCTMRRLHTHLASVLGVTVAVAALAVVPVVGAARPVIGGGFGDTVVIKTNGTLWAAGLNASGQLGAGDKADRTAFTRVGSWSDWTGLSCGGYHCLGLRSDGSLWAWGDNRYGQLGMGVGDITNRTMPTRVGVASDWVAVSCATFFSVALKSDGTLWAWGYNADGELGLGDTWQREIPTPVGTDADWVAVSCGSFHMLALKSNGSLWSWGMNGYGELGRGYTSFPETTPQLVGRLTTWGSLGAAHFCSYALRTNGTLWSWGLNDYGQLGLGDTSLRTWPQQVGSDTTWATVSGSTSWALGLKRNGTLWSWGYNAGQLGLDDTVDRHAPTRVGASKSWAGIVTGAHHSLGYRTNGSLWAWGDDGYGAFGLGAGVQRTYVPTKTPIRLDVTKPVARVLKNVSVKRAHPVKLGYLATDELSPTLKIRIVIRTAGGRPVKTLQLGWKPAGRSFTCGFVCYLTKGVYRCSAYATDLAGNQQTRTVAKKLTVY